MNSLFEFLEKTQGIEQMDKHHPEGDVLNHSLQVLYWAFKESIDTDLILAAMLHDIGKIENSKGHEKIAVEWLQDYVSPKTLWLIEHHMRIWTLIKGDMRKQKKVLELIEHPWLPELILLARWDSIGRDPNKKIIYDKEDIQKRLDRCTEQHFKLFYTNEPKLIIKEVD